MTTAAMSALLTPLEPRTAPRFAGLIGSGMLDWPGRIAATVFVAGCTMRCPYCHNPELVAGRRGASITLDDVLAHLDAKRGWIDGVVVTGGEPTANPDLVEILTAFSDANVPVKLDTNGSRPQVLGRVLALGLVDFVAMDLKTTPARYSAVTGLADAWELARESIDLVRGSGIGHEFRTTCYPLAVKPADLDEIASHVAGAQRLVLQQFRPARTLDPACISVAPYAPDVLRSAAERCKRYLPTVVRGV